MQVREARREDLPSVSRLMRAVAGWQAITDRRWERDWERNPALAADDPPLARGWVLEGDGEIAGFLGNLIQRFEFRGAPLRTATVWGFVVDPGARGGSMQLLRAFTRQPHVDLLLATTATVQVPEILSLMKFERLPVADYDVGLYWVTGARGLVASNLRRIGWPGWAASAAGLLLGPGLWAESRLRARRPPGAAGIAIETLAPERAGDEFDALWRRVRASDTRLALLRSAEILRWHFAAEGWPVAPVLLAARRDGGLLGYAALVRADKPDNGLRRWQVADLLAVGDAPEVIRALLAAAYEHARRDAADMLEVFGMPASLRPLVLEGHPRAWPKASWPYLYKAKDAALAEALRSPDAWYPTLIDGDGCLPHL
jgi:hypothetical protein